MFTGFLTTSFDSREQKERENEADREDDCFPSRCPSLPFGFEVASSLSLSLVSLCGSFILPCDSGRDLLSFLISFLTMYEHDFLFVLKCPLSSDHV